MSNLGLWHRDFFMEIKKFLTIYSVLLLIGTLALKGKDLFQVLTYEGQLAKVAFHVPAKDITLYKTSGSYQEKTLGPVIQYEIDGEMREFNPEYSCTNGCEPVGSQVRIFYNKENLSNIHVMTFNGFFKPLVYFYIIMIVLGLFSLQYLYYVKKPSES